MSWESGGILGGVHTDVFIILNRDLVLQLCETGVGAVWDTGTEDAEEEGKVMNNSPRTRN